MSKPNATRAKVGVLALALSLLPVAAQAQFGYFPYYGKNKVKYDNFDWRIYKSPHFEVYYYPEFEHHLERLVSYAESAYQKVAADLKHEIAFPIPLILYKTSSEFQQTNLYPDFLPEGVLAFAEPVRDRMVIPIDEPPDRLQGLITHELTHIFEFDLIPRSLVQRSVPLWVDEGLADYMRGLWDPLDLMMIRDAAIADQVPKLSRSEIAAIYGNARLVYNLGHAAFEFMEARYGKEGIRQFIYTLRKNVVGGGLEDVYRQAFRTSPEEFDDAFDKWLKERFKAYRDKQRPSDYGRLLSPDSERTPYTQVFGFAPSPSGELVAAFTGNRADGEIDLVLLSTRDGAVIKNLTPGYAGEYEYPDLNLSARIFGRSVAFSPDGGALAFFARTGKRRSLVVASALNGSILKKVPVELDQASAPALLPDGRRALFTALKEGVSDVYLLDLDSGEARNLTQDAFADSDPQISPDGKLVAYSRRVSGHEKLYLFALDDPSRKTPLTFGVQDDVTPTFSPDGSLLYYASNEDDDIYNLRSLDLQTGAVRQYTDVLGGNLMPAVLSGQTQRLAFVSYFKGEYRLHAIDAGDPLKEVEQEVRTADDEFIDFQPDIAHQMVPENKRRKKLFEKLYLDGRPPINVAVTSSGDFYGGTQILLSDVLGDQNFGFTFYSFADYRTYVGSYVNLASRLRWGVYGFDQTNWFYPGNYAYNYYYSRDQALFTQRQTGGLAFAQYPLDKFNRLEFGAGIVKYREAYADPAYQAYIEDLYAQLGVEATFLDGYTAPVTARFVRETTRFREFGPLAGSTVMLGGEVSPGFSGFYSRQTVEADARKYLRFGSTTSLLAARFRGFYSTGDYPDIFWFGGNMDLRGYEYASFVGNQGFFANVELRLPLIDVMRTPIGLLGPVRGVAYVGMGGAKYKGQPYTLWSSDPGISYVNDPIFGEPVDGFHLVDGRASYGFGFQMFFLGYPLHFDWSKFWDFKVSSDSWKFSFWIGYDF
jgi:Tol biopolymer transport system component